MVWYEVLLALSLLGLGWGLCYPTSICVVICFKHARDECEAKKVYVF